MEPSSPKSQTNPLKDLTLEKSLSSPHPHSVFKSAVEEEEKKSTFLSNEENQLISDKVGGNPNEPGQSQLKSLINTETTSERQTLKIAVVGNVDSGKSTLTVVLSCGPGITDDGRGSMRENVFNFGHEKENGRTSSIAHEIIGFD